MAIDYQPLNPVSLSRQIADKIREAIISGDLKADERLPTEDELASRFQVSRPTIREALKRLAAQNLVRSRRGPAGGTFVNRPSRQDLCEGLVSAMTLLAGMGEFGLDEISQARLELERISVRLAVEHHRPEQLELLRRELQLQLDGDLSHEDFCASDVRFHRAIVDMGGNGVLSLVSSVVLESFQPVANLVSFRFRERERIVDQHQRLLQAIADRDAVRAVAVIEEQVEYLRQQQLRARESRNR